MRIALDALKGNSLNIERAGSGTTTIIAIHGFTGSSATWDSFAGAAGAKYNIILPDLLGHGKSDAPDNPELYDMKHTIKALAEVADRFGITEANWLGYSLGGRIALAAAISLKGRVLSVIAESASGGLDDPKERKARKDSDDALANRIEQQSIEEFVDYWQSLPLFGSQIRLPLDDKDKLRAERLANNVKGLANSLRGIGLGTQMPIYKQLPTFACPCLFIAGEEDLKFSEIARRMQIATPRSQLYLGIQSGHTVHLEQPELFNQAVLRFLIMVPSTAQARPGSQPNQ